MVISKDLVIDDSYLDVFHHISKNAQEFIIVREYIKKNEGGSDRNVDTHTKDHLGSHKTFMAMHEIMQYYSMIDWIVAAKYLVRMSDAGYKTDSFTITAPNDIVIDVTKARVMLQTLNNKAN